MQSIALVSVLKFDPAQPRAPKGSGDEAGQFVRRWGNLGEEERRALAAPRATEARQVDIDLVRSALVTQAQILAGPEVMAEIKEYGIEAPTQQQFPVRTAVKRAIVADLANRLKDHPAFGGMPVGAVQQFVQTQVDQWAETSGDSEQQSIWLQRAVQEEFGLRAAPTDHMANVDEPTAIHRARERAFVRAEYERTQEFLKSKGLTHVSLFRGMSNKDADIAPGWTSATMQPASSWSTSLDIAVRFAIENDDPEPILLTTRVPIEQVLSTAVTGRGCLPEEELILLGQRTRMRVYDLADDELEDEDGQRFATPESTRAAKTRIKANLK